MQRAAVGATPVVPMPVATATPMPVATATPMPIAPVTPMVASVGGSQGTGHWVDKAAIVAKVRAGQCIHGEQEAVPYANACEFNPAAMTGCYCIKCGSKSGIPVGLTYNFFLGPWFCFQPCLPLPLWCGCSDEREGNVYINRGKQGRGTVMVIDEEMGTLACYHCEEEASGCLGGFDSSVCDHVPVGVPREGVQSTWIDGHVQLFYENIEMVRMVTQQSSVHKHSHHTNG